MRKFLSFLMIFVLIGIGANAQKKVALVDDDNAGASEVSVIYDALMNGGFIVNTFDMATLDTLVFSDISSYDMVLWYVGNDRVSVNLWDTVTTQGVVQFYPALKQYYNRGTGSIWIDGIDIFLPILVQTNGNIDPDYTTITRPHSFNSGDFIYDILGIQSWDYESYTDDTSGGVPQLDKSSGNTFTSLNPITWRWSSLYRCDGWTPVAGAISLYEMGPSSYAGAGNTSFHKYVNNGINMYVSSVRLSSIGDGSAVVQASIDDLVADIVNDAPLAKISNIETKSLNIYPNPVVENATINISEINKASELTIYDNIGRKVYTQPLYSGQENVTINVADFASGLYHININTDNSTYTTKMSVVK